MAIARSMGSGNRNVFAFCVFIAFLGIVTPVDVKDGEEEGFIFVKPAIDKPLDKDATDAEIYPEELTVTLNDSVTLHLTKNTVTDVNVPVYVIKDGAVERLSVPKMKDLSFYQDKQYMASLSVSKAVTKDGQIKRKLEGHFVLNKHEYVLSPANEEEAREKRSVDDDVSAWHVMRRIQSTALSSFIGDTSRDKISQKIKRKTQDKTTRFKRAVQRLGVELLMVIDFSVYNRFYQTSTATTNEGKQTDSINRIRYYFAHIANGIDVRYENIVDPAFSIYVRLVGFFVAQDAASSLFTEPFKEAASPRYLVDASLGLNNFTDWVAAKGDALPPHDHAMLFTNYDLYNGINPDTGEKKTSVAGVATLSGICTRGHCSINEDHGGFKSIGVAAHELGHNLGAYHDGDGNTCREADQYIMAAVAASTTSANHYNPYNFSTCSVDYFRNLINDLNSDSNNCMVNEASYFNATEWEVYQRTNPGQRLTPHDQCREVYGAQSYYCGGAASDAEICVSMYCYDPNRGSCFSMGSTGAARGTSCGNHKWCIEGVCTYNSSAPAAPDTCTFGDYVGAVYAGDSRTCAQFKAENATSQCYNDYFRNRCCEFCASIFNSAATGCEYGDRQGNCQSLLSNGICYSFSWVNSTCCKTCQEAYTGISGCEYGDRASACSTLTAAQCYPNDITCCNHCRQFYTGNPECKYGDRESWCARNVCAFEANRASCCWTCAPELGITFPTTTTESATTTAAVTTVTVSSSTVTGTTQAATVTTTTTSPTVSTTVTPTVSMTTPDSTTPSSVTGFTDAEIAELVALHNYYRKNVNPGPAANMRSMVWDPELARLMSAPWANTCANAHGNPNKTGTIFEGKSLGQNLYAYSAKPTVQQIVDAWHSEVSYYTYSSRSCSYVCGHYTQVVWDTSYRLGCAIAYCPLSVYKYQVTCDYYEPGNYGGQHPYDLGTACSGCLTDKYNKEICADGLCVTQYECMQNTSLNCASCSSILECQNSGRYDYDTCSCECANLFYGPTCQYLNCSALGNNGEDVYPSQCATWAANNQCDFTATGTGTLVKYAWCPKACGVTCSSPPVETTSTTIPSSATTSSTASTSMSTATTTTLAPTTTTTVAMTTSEGPTPSSVTGFTDAEIAELVALHNYYRKNVNPGPAANMRSMVWDPELARLMSAPWANTCANAHGNPNKTGTIFEGKSLGQNLYAYSAKPTVQQIVDAWHSEVSYYTYSSRSCSYVCGHYTQVVWDTSYRLGCAIAYCPLSVYKYQVTCDYYEPGNYGGQHPYDLGTACSGCLTDKYNKEICADGLCVTQYECMQNTSLNCASCSSILECQNSGRYDFDTCSCECGNIFYGPTCQYLNCSALGNNGEDVYPSQCASWAANNQCDVTATGTGTLVKYAWCPKACGVTCSSPPATTVSPTTAAPTTAARTTTTAAPTTTTAAPTTTTAAPITTTAAPTTTTTTVVVVAAPTTTTTTVAPITTTTAPTTTTAAPTTTTETTPAAPITTTETTAAPTTTSQTTLKTTTVAPSTTTSLTTTTTARALVTTRVYVFARVRITALNSQPAIFSPELETPTSPTFIQLELTVCQVIVRSYRGTPFEAKVRCRVRRFILGSIIADVQLTFDNQTEPVVNTTQVQETLTQGLQNSPNVTVDTVTVTDFDECNSTDTNDCSLYAQCTNLDGGYTCQCNINYRDNSANVGFFPGRACGQVCRTDLCLNGGVCMESSDGLAMCNCPVNFSGSRCENQLSTDWEEMVIILSIMIGLLIVLIVITAIVCCILKRRSTDTKKHKRRRTYSSSTVSNSDVVRQYISHTAVPDPYLATAHNPYMSNGSYGRSIRSIAVPGLPDVFHHGGSSKRSSARDKHNAREFNRQRSLFRAKDTPYYEYVDYAAFADWPPQRSFRPSSQDRTSRYDSQKYLRPMY
ncbi:uncharacterized protein LOC106173376 [Lingula anatina]|uniref:Uncharacterized protein LOC106173376 n=1 Tax=Lingula anatina TaxID=7574 RepID=A0A1S3JII5_LINAN|nr:uncharacterized protein LOC106173376 [Lingula anatina]|eukprot:XP_013409946.1 uncharacterized protein LOC106173376 [Lingula anatina]